MYKSGSASVHEDPDPGGLFKIVNPCRSGDSQHCSALYCLLDLMSSYNVKGWGRWSSEAYQRYTRLKIDQKRDIFLHEDCHSCKTVLEGVSFLYFYSSRNTINTKM